MSPLPPTPRPNRRKVAEIRRALASKDPEVIHRGIAQLREADDLALWDLFVGDALSPEGVLSVAPDHILAIEGAGPPETINVLKASGLPFTTVLEASDGPGILEKIAVVGHALGLPDRAATLSAETRAALDATARMTAQIAPGEARRVLFILSLQGGRILAGGTGTQAAGIIEMAGAVNAVEDIDGYKQLTDEAVSRAAPDVILMMDRGGDHAIEDEVLLSMPAIRTTPAATTGAVIRMQGLYLLGFGPRTAQAARDLHSAIYATTQADDDTDPS